MFIAELLQKTCSRGSALITPCSSSRLAVWSWESEEKTRSLLIGLTEIMRNDEENSQNCRGCRWMLGWGCSSRCRWVES